jgi:hypothetical protein
MFQHAHFFCILMTANVSDVKCNSLNTMLLDHPKEFENEIQSF